MTEIIIGYVIWALLAFVPAVITVIKMIGNHPHKVSEWLLLGVIVLVVACGVPGAFFALANLMAAFAEPMHAAAVHLLQ